MGPVAWFRDLVQTRGQSLRSRSLVELQALAGSPTEHVSIGSRKGTISIIIEPQGDGSLRVVVQGFMKTFVRIGSHVALDGFYKHPDGRVTPMANREFYDYD
jgi:hypothetical protein